MFTVGDVVVRNHSKAKTLKRRVYRVEQVQGGYGYASKVLCRDPFGNQHEFQDYQLTRVDRQIDAVRHEIYIHDEKRIDLQNKLSMLEQEVRELKLYFPPV